jgi:hypothetical protein
MMLGSKEKFWANANHHPLDRPSAGHLKGVQGCQEERWPTSRLENSLFDPIAHSSSPNAS